MNRDKGGVCDREFPVTEAVFGKGDKDEEEEVEDDDDDDDGDDNDDNDDDADKGWESSTT